jgi:hypothetical protein
LAFGETAFEMEAKSLSPPEYQAPPPDPMLAQQEAQAKVDQTNALQGKLQGDTASIMARYGALLSMQGSTGGTAGK